MPVTFFYNKKKVNGYCMRLTVRRAHDSRRPPHDDHANGCLRACALRFLSQKMEEHLYPLLTSKFHRPTAITRTLAAVTMSTLYSSIISDASSPLVSYELVKSPASRRSLERSRLPPCLRPRRGLFVIQIFFQRILRVTDGKVKYGKITLIPNTYPLSQGP